MREIRVALPVVVSTVGIEGGHDVGTTNGDGRLTFVLPPGFREVMIRTSVDEAQKGERLVAAAPPDLTSAPLAGVGEVRQ